MISQTFLLSLFCRFYINPSTGAIYLVSQLDYETQTEYSFLVFASDKASIPKTGQVLVRIQVTDYNDVGPEFTLPLYTARVLESSTVFQSPVRVTVSEHVFYFLMWGAGGGGGSSFFFLCLFRGGGIVETLGPCTLVRNPMLSLGLAQLTAFTLFKNPLLNFQTRVSPAPRLWKMGSPALSTINPLFSFH